MNEKKSLVFGLHAVNALLMKHPARLQVLYLLKERDDQKIQALIQLAKLHKIKIEFLSRNELDRLSDQENHQGVIAICHPAKMYSENDLVTLIEMTVQPFFLILDGVQDPHNLGACLRSADAAGVTAVLAPKDKSVGITPTVAKVASGAAETVPFIQVTNLARTMKFLQQQGIWIYGASDDAEKTLYQIDFSGRIALVLGAEGSGLRRLTREHCDVLAKIPMHGSVSSLNVSVATGVFLFEAVRQRIS